MGPHRNSEYPHTRAQPWERKREMNFFFFNIKKVWLIVNSNGPSSGGLSYYNNPGQEPLRAITVGQLVDHAAYTWPERRALVSMHENITVTYAELRQQVIYKKRFLQNLIIVGWNALLLK